MSTSISGTPLPRTRRRKNKDGFSDVITSADGKRILYQ